MLRTGDELKGYRIVAALRAGGMARLYLARREGVKGFSRPAAIKVIHPHLAREARFVELFIAEARLSSKIEHPNVVRVEDLGETAGVLFLAMEYVHGVSLSELIVSLKAHERRLSFEAVAHIGMRVATGLHAAHETSHASSGKLLGIVHCDVSPQNILVGFGGHVKVIDFGVAKALGGAPESSQSSLRGKIAYMAPEQAGGRTIDRRTDVYALGIVLWELLTLERLYQAHSDVALLARVQDGLVPLPTARVADVPPALARVVMKALARDPADRYATALELARALGDAVPAARSLEPEELGALVTAAAPDEAKKREALLALAAGDGETEPSATDDGAATDTGRSLDLPSTQVARVRRPTQPSVVFEHLTLPLAPRASDDDAHAERPVMSPRPAPRVPSRRWAWSLVAALVTVGTFAAVSAFAHREPASSSSPAEIATSEPSIEAPPSTPPTTTPTTATTTTPPPSAAVATPPDPSTPTATATSTRAPIRAHATKGAALPAAVPTMRCRMVAGVELCQ